MPPFTEFVLPGNRAPDAVSLRRPSRSWRLRLLAVMCSGPLALALMPPDAASASLGSERALLAAINTTRSEHGLSPLVVSTELRAAARRHSAAMISHNRLYHSDLVGITGRRLGENVAFAPTVEDIHALLLASSAHRANLLDKEMTQIGLAVDYDNGLRWATQIFRQPR